MVHYNEGYLYLYNVKFILFGGHVELLCVKSINNLKSPKKFQMLKMRKHITQQGGWHLWKGNKINVSGRSPFTRNHLLPETGTLFLLPLLLSIDILIGILTVRGEISLMELGIFNRILALKGTFSSVYHIKSHYHFLELP